MMDARYCPYCHAAFPADAAPVCTSVGCFMRGRSVQTHPERHRARLPRAVRMLAARSTSGRAHLCERCKAQGRYLCAACARELPAQFGRYPELSVTLLGAQGAGKSTQLACMLFDLASAGHAQLRALDMETTAERLYAEYTQPLFEKNRQVRETPRESPPPLIYAVSAQRHPLLPAQGALLSVYDPPGAYFTRHAATRELAPLLAHTDAYVLCVNPTRADAGEEFAQAERMLDMLRLSQDLGEACASPVAVVLTHCDQWLLRVTPLPCQGREHERDLLLREYALSLGGAGLLARLREYRFARLFAGGLFRDKEGAAPLIGARAPLAYVLRHTGLYIQ